MAEDQQCNSSRFPSHNKNDGDMSILPKCIAVIKYE